MEIQKTRGKNAGELISFLQGGPKVEQEQQLVLFRAKHKEEQLAAYRESYIMEPRKQHVNGIGVEL